MATPAERISSTPDARDPIALVAREDAADSAFCEWGYEAADPNVLARQWGECSWSAEDRSR